MNLGKLYRYWHSPSDRLRRILGNLNSLLGSQGAKDLPSLFPSNRLNSTSCVCVPHLPGGPPSVFLHLSRQCSSIADILESSYVLTHTIFILLYVDLFSYYAYSIRVSGEREEEVRKLLLLFLILHPAARIVTLSGWMLQLSCNIPSRSISYASKDDYYVLIKWA